MLKRVVFYFFIIFTFFPVFCLASVSFSEIMYDPDGSDAGYEWIEIKNNSENKENLKDWKFCEGKDTTVCHSLREDDNPDFNLEGNSFGIITDDREKFLEKNNFSGLVIESTGFSLLNSEGEKLELKNSSGNIIDAIIYNPESGGKAGATLCLIIDVWRDCENTAGNENCISGSNDDNSDDGDDNNDNNDDNNENDNQEEEEEDEPEIFIPNTYVEFTDLVGGKKRIKAEINEFATAIAGARAVFSGRAFGLTDNEIHTAEYFWSMGDGAKEKGKEIYHEYEFPGEYIISLTTKVGNFTGSHKRKIKVIEPEITFSNIDFEKNFVEISNNSSEILNLENWVITIDGDEFKIPDNTYIQNNNKIIFSNKIMGFRDFDENSRIKFLFPNEQVFYTFTKQEPPEETKNTDNPEPKKTGIPNSYTKKQYKPQKNTIHPKVIEEKPKPEDKDESKNKELDNIGAQGASIINSFDVENINLNFDDFFKENIFYLIFLSITGIMVIVILINNLYLKTDEKNIESEKIKKEIEDFKIEEIKE